jgi:hypothetical protein
MQTDAKTMMSCRKGSSSLARSSAISCFLVTENNLFRHLQEKQKKQANRKSREPAAAKFATGSLRFRLFF